MRARARKSGLQSHRVMMSRRSACSAQQSASPAPRRPRCGMLFASLALLLLALARPVPTLAAGSEVVRQASPGPPSMLPEASAGFDGYTRAGRSLSVRAVVANDGPPLDGQLQLSTRPGNDAAVYTQRVEVATRARKLLTFQIPAPATPGQLKLVLQVGDTELGSRELPLRQLGATDFLVGVVTDDGAVPSGLGAVRRGGNPVAIARLTPADLPADPLVLQTVDALVIRQASSDRLAPDQRAALRTWIEQGGQLIIAGGPGWRRSIEGLDDLLPVEGLWTRQVKHLHALDRYAGVGPKESDVLVTLGSPIEGARVLLAQEGIPLLVERWLGLGRVTFIGPDPGLEPFTSWPGAESVWQRVLLGGAALLRGPDVRLAALSIVRIADGTHSSPQDTFVGLVAPTRGSYSLALVDGQIPRPLADAGGPGSTPLTIAPGIGGAPTTLPDLRFEGRVPRAFQLRTLVDAPAPVTADLKTTNGRLEGTIRNTGRDRLEDAILIAAGEAIGLGDLAPGDSRTVSISLPTNSAAGAWQNGPPPWAVPGARTGAGGDRRRALISQLIQPSRGNDGESNG